MTLPTDAVTLAGSGLVFINSYDPNVSAAYEAAVVTAENFLQSHFTNALTVSVDFSYSSLGAGVSGENNFNEVDVSYTSLASALRSHATTANDFASVNGLPATDPSNGVGFAIPEAQAVMLGLAPQTNDVDDQVTLNSTLGFTFGQDAVGVIEHEISEGVFGRTSSLGFAETKWNPLDLFRFTAAGVRDYTGGSDGVATFFGIDSSDVSSLQYHNSVSATGHFDGQDLGDWDQTVGDAFGPGGPGSPGVVSATDLQVLDVLGWNATPFTPAPDDYANSLTDTTHPIGQLAIGGSISAALQEAGDRDWFAVQFQAGDTYTINEVGSFGGGGTLADPYLRLHDSTGAQVAFDDDIVDGTDPDSRIVFAATTTGTFYVEAGAYVDGYAGTYTVSVAQTGGAVAPTGGGEVLTPGPGDNTLEGGSGNDTITGGSGNNYLRGEAGDDSIVGGSGFNDMNGNMGNDTLHGGTGSNWVVGGQGDDSLVGGGGYQDLVLGNLGNDTLQAGSQGDVLRGGQGDDSIVGGAGNDYISGDLGNDTVSGGGGADIFHGSVSIGMMKVLDFNYAQGDRVELDPGTLYSVAQVGADTVITVSSGGEMDLVGVTFSTLPSDWIFLGTLSHL
ncbi:NF038122 family metalloprotease [Phenylobacterium sp.]|uniref:NF038122 family metalloprotease n=1 Tax=Phenylobacterium sp. TaxID=1871053 RepID=UPI001218EBF7|nr:NF038122 family metalloprotease [Phenylobacterium sp.]THD55839.1 MAG: calcium-binding protein [Phenylobacterium sp.]